MISKANIRLHVSIHEIYGAKSYPFKDFNIYLKMDNFILHNYITLILSDMWMYIFFFSVK